MPIINLGILAHVDAGKTSLTERILYNAGVISGIGRVDHGTSQMDTLDLERERGITIQAAVVSFRLGDLIVNLIDTPGHADFIAEVDRALAVLDAVIVVVSAVEGVQSQTRKLVRAVRDRGLPLLLFINKIDRTGARDDALVAEIARLLGLRPLVMSTVAGIGTKEAVARARSFADEAFATHALDVLSTGNDELIQAYLLAEGDISNGLLEGQLADRIADGGVVPVYFGSAMTGAGVKDVMTAIGRWLPAAPEDGAPPLAASIFKIQRSPTGEKLAIARLFGGSIAVRDTIPIVRPDPDPDPDAEADHARVTAIERYVDGAIEHTATAGAGQIVRLHGLAGARIGDALGCPPDRRLESAFARPTLESVIRAAHPAAAQRLWTALTQLDEADPLISIRRHPREHTITVRLYGEVQKEVIAATLARDHAVEVTFEPSRVIHIERVVGIGEAAEVIFTEGNPFAAGVALRIGPGAPGSGVRYRAGAGQMPHAMYRAIEETVRTVLDEGLYGWSVVDCDVELTACGFCAPVSVAADYRNLTPLVLMTALRRARTVVEEPIEAIELDLPESASGEALRFLGAARGIPDSVATDGTDCRITGIVPTAELPGFEQHLPRLGSGEAALVARPAGYQPVAGEPPRRPRTDCDPLNRVQYLRCVR